MEKNLIQDLSFLSSNDTGARGILIGNLKGKVYIGYFIMGRNETAEPLISGDGRLLTSSHMM